MSRILTTHVSLWDPSGDLAVLAPGTELPEWAEGRIGDHCLEPEAETEVPDFTDADAEGSEGADGDPADDTDKADDGEEAGEGKADEGDDVDPAAKTDAPDFTAPAPRRGRPRKA